MSGAYRTFHTRRLVDELRSLAAPAPNAKWLAVYMQIGTPATPIPGVCITGRLATAELLEWEPADFDRVVAELVEGGILRVDWKARLAVQPSVLREAAPHSFAALKTWHNTFREIPDCELKSEIDRIVRQDVLSQLGAEWGPIWESGAMPTRKGADAVGSSGKGPGRSPGKSHGRGPGRSHGRGSPTTEPIPVNSDQEHKHTHPCALPSDASPSDSALDADRGFEAFYAEYPRKQGKEEAREIWMERNLGQIVDRIMDGLARYNTGRRATSGRLRSPFNWLKYRLWEDEEDPEIDPFS